MPNPFNDALQAIIDVLKADTNLTVNTKVSEYIYGDPIVPPKIVNTARPTIAVSLLGGSYQDSGLGVDILVMRFAIAIFCRDVTHDKAEQTAEDFAEKVRAALQANDNLVVSSVAKAHTLKLTGFSLDRLINEDTFTIKFSWFLDVYQES